MKKLLLTIIMLAIRALDWISYSRFIGAHQKFVDNVRIDGVAVNSRHGYKAVSEVGITKPLDSITIELEDGKHLTCADDHILLDETSSYILAKDTMGRLICTTNGPSRVVSISPGRMVPMYDLTLSGHSPHTYYTNDIESHNTITVAIYIVWYILNHTDRNVMVVSQNGDKVKELMDKIKVVIKGLPFYMKPGMITNNVMTMAFDNGCKIHAQTTTSNSGASFTVHLLYIDEFALINKAYLDEFYRTVYPTISSSEISRIILSSTPRGINKFYEIYVNAINGENFYNPIRVDWYDVPGRDEEWKRMMIADLGSEEDFNQEFGNQFYAGAKLIFNSNQLKALKQASTTYVPLNMSDYIDGWASLVDPSLSDKDKGEVEPGDGKDLSRYMLWHPKFDLTRLGEPKYQFVISVDIAEGVDGDYFVANFFQILPMTLAEVAAAEVYSDIYDFFKLVQVGILRNNDVDVPVNANFLYAMLLGLTAVDSFYDREEDVEYVDHMVNISMVVELNKEGRFFIKCLESVGGDNNQFNSDSVVAKFLHRIDSVNPKPGVRMNTSTVTDAIKKFRLYMRYNRMVILEKTTVEESTSMLKGDDGKYVSQTKYDDCFDTCRNVSLFLENPMFREQVDSMLEVMPLEFLQACYSKLGVDVEDEGAAMVDILDAI